MQIGFNAPTTGALIEPDSLRRIITEGEALGFDYVTSATTSWCRAISNRSIPIPTLANSPPAPRRRGWSSSTTTAYIAALTTKLRFVMSVMVVPHRPAGADREDPRHHRLSVEGPADARHRRRLVPRGVRGDRRRAVRRSRSCHRRMDDGLQGAVDRAMTRRFDGKYVKFSDVVFTPKPVQQPIPIWVGGESGPALRRTVRYADRWYPVGTNPQFPMNTVSRFKAGVARFRGLAEKAGRDPAAQVGLAVVLVVRSARRSRADRRRAQDVHRRRRRLRGRHHGAGGDRGQRGRCSACSATTLAARSTTCAASATR